MKLLLRFLHSSSNWEICLLKYFTQILLIKKILWYDIKAGTVQMTHLDMVIFMHKTY